jgi:hypothetical protein
MDDLHWTWTPTFVTILSIPINHEHRNSTVVHIEYLPIGISDNISEATKHVSSEHTPDLSSSSRYFLMMEAKKFPKLLVSFVNWCGWSPGIFSCRENRATEPTCLLCAKTIKCFSYGKWFSWLNRKCSLLCIAGYWNITSASSGNNCSYRPSVPYRHITDLLNISFRQIQHVNHFIILDVLRTSGSVSGFSYLDV